jgi:spore coat polysaccharide biosynthesis protein SpsF (cytidylyltransferase family)
VNVIEHIIRRADFFGLDPIVCTTNQPADDVLEATAIKNKVKYFRGDEKDKLKRWLDCCDALKIEAFHSVDADDPFFDAKLVKKSFALLATGFDMVSPTKSSSMGSASVGYSLKRDIIAKACAIKKSQDTEMMWYYLEKVPGIKQIQLPDEDPHPLKVRLTLDYEEDYWLLCTVQRSVGGNASRHDVDDLFRRNPDLYKVNWFRNQEWKETQLAKKI